MKVEIWVLHLQAKGHQRHPANGQKLWEKPGAECPWQPYEGTNPANLDMELLASRTVRE